jgi:RNA polymerase sigma-70 factor (ECF subfamily)
MTDELARPAGLALLFAPESDLRVSEESGSVDPFERRAIAAVRGGDANAYDYLVSKYAKRVLGIAVGLVRNRHDAEDLAQEAFVRGFRSLDRFRTAESFGPWIFRIVTNLSLDLLRSQKRSVEEPGDLERVVEGNELEARERTARIDAAIESLPRMQRVVARLYLVEEFSHGEIASMTGLSEGTIRSHLSHARARLQEALHDLRPHDGRGGEGTSK